MPHDSYKYVRYPIGQDILFGLGCKHYEYIPSYVCTHPDGSLKKWCIWKGFRWYR